MIDAAGVAQLVEQLICNQPVASSSLVTSFSVKTPETAKNQYLQEMIQEVLSWGLKPTAFTSDAWYASKAAFLGEVRLWKNTECLFQTMKRRLGF